MGRIGRRTGHDASSSETEHPQRDEDGPGWAEQHRHDDHNNHHGQEPTELDIFLGSLLVEAVLDLLAGRRHVVEWVLAGEAVDPGEVGESRRGAALSSVGSSDWINASVTITMRLGACLPTGELDVICQEVDCLDDASIARGGQQGSDVVGDVSFGETNDLVGGSDHEISDGLRDRFDKGGDVHLG